MKYVRRGGGMAAIALMLTLAGSVQAAEFKGGLLTLPKAAPDFTLTTQDGKDFRLSRERGSVVALSFGYTFCPDVCPTTLAELSQARTRLGADAKRFRIVFVTVDPERDTPARLREYTDAFSRSFTALTAPPERLAEVRKAYGVVAKKQVVAGTSATYLIDHSAFVYVIDPAGQLRLMFPFGMSVDDMVHDFKLLLRR
jgi:protein SCO1/2